MKANTFTTITQKRQTNSKINGISEEKTGGELYYLLFKAQLKATGSKIIRKSFTSQFQLM